MSRQCHARNKDRQRCSQPADHEGDHYILVEWMDGDSYDPNIDMPIPFVAPQVFTGGQILSNTSAAAADIPDEPDPDAKCFSCGVRFSVHDDDNPDGCRAFIE